jgi:hypothetical protein
MRFLHRFGPGDHRIEIDELAVMFRILLRPDFLHRLDRFAHPLEAGRIDGAVVFHFVLVPAAADAEQEPSLACLVDRVALATLDDDPGVRPDAHAFIVDKAPWFTVTDDLPQYPARVPGQNAPHDS